MAADLGDAGQPPAHQTVNINSDAAAIYVQTIKTDSTEVWIYIIEYLTGALIFNWVFAAGGVHLTFTRVLAAGILGFVDTFWGFSRQSVCLSRICSRGSDAAATLAWTDVWVCRTTYAVFRVK